MAHFITTPYDHETNGVAERYNRTILTMALKMLKDGGIPLMFWPDAVKHANQIKNRIYHSTTGKIPLEHQYGLKADHSFIKVFGCVAWVRVPKERRHGKLDDKSILGMHLGHYPDKGGWKIYIPETNKYIYSRSVKFDDSKFLKDTQNFEWDETDLEYDSREFCEITQTIPTTDSNDDSTDVVDDQYIVDYGVPE